MSDKIAALVESKKQKNLLFCAIIVCGAAIVFFLLKNPSGEIATDGRENPTRNRSGLTPKTPHRNNATANTGGFPDLPAPPPPPPVLDPTRLPYQEEIDRVMVKLSETESQLSNINYQIEWRQSALHEQQAMRSNMQNNPAQHAALTAIDDKIRQLSWDIAYYQAALPAWTEHYQKITKLHESYRALQRAKTRSP